MSQHQPPDIRPAITVVEVVVMVFSCIAVGLRVVARRMSAGLWWDDWLVIFAALPLAIACNISTLVAVRTGPAGHPLEVQDGGVSYHKNFYAQAIMYNTCLLAVKIAVLIMYWRLFSVKPAFRMSMYVVGVLVMLSWASAEAVNIFHCTPIRKAWQLYTPGTCIPKTAFLAGQVIPNVVTDIMIIVLPMPIIWGLKRTVGERAIIFGIFLLGSFTIHTSIGRMAAVIILPPTEVIWTSFPLIVLSALEPAVAIISSCLPTMGPLFRFSVQKLSQRSTSTASPASPVGFRPSASRHKHHLRRDSLDNEDQQILTGRSQTTKTSDDASMVEHGSVESPEIAYSMQDLSGHGSKENRSKSQASTFVFDATEHT